LLRRDLHASLNRTTDAATGCFPIFADEADEAVGQAAHAYKSYPELAYSGVLASPLRDSDPQKLFLGPKKYILS
jgi:hypothetical protein